MLFLGIEGIKHIFSSDMCVLFVSIKEWVLHMSTILEKVLEPRRTEKCLVLHCTTLIFFSVVPEMNHFFPEANYLSAFTQIILWF